MLELRAVTRQFGEKKALDHVDLQIRPGELTCIVGSSGSGKTTLLQLLGGSDKPTEGDVFYNGSSIYEDAAAYCAAHVGLVFQDSNLIDGLTVEQNAVLGAALCRRAVSTEEVAACLSYLGISNGQQAAQTLSGGEKQRVAMARAVLKNADIILADEPTGNLDPANADHTFELLASLKKDRHVIVVTHDVERARRYADTIVCLQEGRVAEVSAIRREAEVTRAVPQIGAAQHTPKGSGAALRPLLLSSVKRRWKSFLGVATVLALLVSILAMALDMQNLGENVNKNVNFNYFETDLLSVTKTSEKLVYDACFSENDLAALQNAAGIVETVNRYDTFVRLSFSNGDRRDGSADVKTVELNEFFAERVMSNEIVGRFPTAEEEVILSADTALLLGLSESDVGKTVNIHLGMRDAYAATVVGINKTQNPEGKTFSFVPAALVRKMVEATIRKDIAERKMMDFALSAAGYLDVCSGSEELMYGRLPTAPDEVIVSHTYLSSVVVQASGIVSSSPGNSQYIEGEVKIKLQLEDMENGTVTEAEYAAATADLIYVRAGTQPSHMLKIVGVYRAVADENGEKPVCAAMTAEGIEKICNPQPTAVDLYFSDTDKALEAKENLARQDYRFTSVAESLQSRVNDWAAIYAFVLMMVSMGLLLILIITLSTFSKMLLNERKREIAVLRSLGARGGDIFALTVFDFLVVYGIAAVLAAVVTAVYPITFTQFLSEGLSYATITYPVKELVLFGLGALPLLLLLALPVIIRMTRIYPSVLFKEI